jgi:hypothetical protein
MFLRQFITKTPVMAAVRRFIPHFAATFARGLALVQDQMAGDECSGAERRLP